MTERKLIHIRSTDLLYDLFEKISTMTRLKMNEFMLISARTKSLYSYKESAEKLLLSEGNNLDIIPLSFCYLPPPSNEDNTSLGEKWVNVTLKMEQSIPFKVDLNETVISLKQRIESEFSVPYKQQLLKLHGNVLMKDPFQLLNAYEIVENDEIELFVSILGG